MFVFTSLVSVSSLTGCGDPVRQSDVWRPDASLAKQSDVVGTWRWSCIRGGGKKEEKVDEMLFMRFYPDGTFTSWFPPEVVHESRSSYKVENGMLLFSDPALEKKLVKVRATRNTMWMEIAGGQFEYSRVEPDLEPGEFPKGDK